MPSDNEATSVVQQSIHIEIPGQGDQPGVVATLTGEKVGYLPYMVQGFVKFYADRRTVLLFPASRILVDMTL